MLSPYYKVLLNDSKDRVMKFITPVLKKNSYTLNNITLDMFDRTTNLLGNCKSKSVVSLNKSLLDKGSELDIDSVMAHEILHCVKEASGHNKIWKSLARQVSEIAPFEIYTYSNETIRNNDNLLSCFKYVARCECCHKVYYTGKKRTWKVDYIAKGLHKCKCGGKILMEVK